jgi:hypothetical protein
MDIEFLCSHCGQLDVIRRGTFPSSARLVNLTASATFCESDTSSRAAQG